MPSRARPLTIVAVSAVALAAAGAAFWLKTGPTGAPAPGANPAAATDGPAIVGADACAPCHATEFAEWKASPHAHNMARPTPQGIVGDFERDNVHTFGGTISKFSRQGDQYVLDYTGAEGKTERWTVDWAIGITRHQVYAHVFPDGRIQVLPTYWNLEKHTWQDAREGPISDTPIPIPSTFPDFWQNYGRNYNRTCMECHSSRPAKHYDGDKNTYASTFVPEIDCEACHGPGGKHARAWANAQQAGTTATADREMPKLGLLSEEEAIERCSACHARKRVYGEGYQPGDVYADFFAPDPWERGATFVDGRPSDLSYHYVDYMMSACYRSSPEKLGCSGPCHAPHSLAKTRKTSVADSNAICTRCHVKYNASLTEHTFHKPESDGSRCIECHMPPVDLQLQMTSRDHSIGVPLPELTIGDNVPNACANCHADDPASWAQKWVLKWWGDRPTFQAYRARVLARADVLRQVFAERPPVEPLARWLDNPAASVVERASAARFLGAVERDPRAFEALARHADDPLPLVRYFVADALGSLGDRGVDDVLKKMCADSARTVRVRAFEALVLRHPELTESPDPAYAAVRKEYQARADLVRPDDPRSLAPMALMAYQLGHVDVAEKLLRRTAAIGRDVPGFRSDLIQFLMERNRMDEAQVEVDKLAKADPEGMASTFMRGLVLLARGRAADALPFLEKASTRPEAPPMLFQALAAARQAAGR